jgi:hypothetical protein
MVEPEASILASSERDCGMVTERLPSHLIVPGMIVIGNLVDG